MTNKCEYLPEEQRPVYTSNFMYCGGCSRRIHKDLFDSHTTCRCCRGVYDEEGGLNMLEGVGESKMGAAV